MFEGIGIHSAKMALRIAALSCLLAFTNAGTAKPRVTDWAPAFDRLGLRVIGGENADPAEFPHQVTLQYSPSSRNPLSHFCGGSIVDPEWILTAAHCAKAIPARGVIVVKAGKRNIQIKERTEQSVRVEKIFIHKLYAGGVGAYDIALLKLKHPLTLTIYVKKIKLPRPGVVPTGNAILSGWGSINRSPYSSLPPILQKATLPILDHATCEAAIKEQLAESPLHKTNICTGPLSGGLGACSGDSGGPLIQISKNGTSELIGIVSWGFIPCGGADAPSVFVKVSDFIDWIEKIMSANAEKKTLTCQY